MLQYSRERFAFLSSLHHVSKRRHHWILQGMLAGENTLNALCARLVMRTVAANKGQYDSAKFLGDYVKARPDGSSPPTPSAAAVVSAPGRASRRSERFDRSKIEH